MIKQLENYLQQRCTEYVGQAEERACGKMALKKALWKKRGAELMNVKARGRILSTKQEEGETKVTYNIHWRYFLKQRDLFYMEEEIEKRCARFGENELLSNEEVAETKVIEEIPALVYEGEPTRAPFYYDRLKAVQYANLWWNGTNPKYRRFNDDCTNFISQCLHAGGAPMHGAPNRSAGWWYGGGTWSYSWTVAHALQLYLKNSKGGLNTREVETVDELQLGDIICYDFEGDGRFNHNTIITAVDIYDVPLVNAHTTDSRHRFWSYEDSTAYTPNIQYRFYAIVDDA